ncbi:YjfB family protein [Acetobacterium sp.]|uniref:YjfB family protein n=1 Tax=Acetobacterium sp. TaxID=1872094 RepID=UPI000CAE4BDF|nr:YjfB family protein [Acetobacterium sp.]MDO9492024.1 YjfB family protein [Acetobacterium sp.]PKM70897.1 MAG: putative motility protein [Firmicutes bacterium HGW-Firmicutes-17]
MDIAALSMGMSQMQVAQQASISVMKMAMETGTEQMTDMMAMVETSAPVAAVAGPSPDANIGRLLDISV